jgi:hypothetical protein
MVDEPSMLAVEWKSRHQDRRVGEQVRADRDPRS